MVFTEETVRNILLLGRELPAIECKGATSINDRWMLGKVLRAMMGMANLEGGGLVILGISEKKTPQKHLVPTPFVQTDLDTWDHESLQNKAAPYFDPPVVFALSKIQVDSNWYIGIAVSEFSDIPVLAQKEYSFSPPAPQKQEIIIREGGCYVRSQAKLSTENLPTSTDMRVLLSYAVQKGLRREIARLQSLGLVGVPKAPESDASSKSFDDQAKDLL